MSKPKQSPGPPMTLGNMRQLGMQNLIGYCLSDACRHSALINVSKYADDVAVPWFCPRAKCSKCRERRVEIRPKWTEQPPASPKE
jgi:hypothetical protein